MSTSQDFDTTSTTRGQTSFSTNPSSSSQPTGAGAAKGPARPGQSDFASQVQAQLQQGSKVAQDFIANNDLTPRNQFVMHAAYAAVVGTLLWLVPSLLLKYNPLLFLARTIVAVPHKEGSYGFYALLAYVSAGVSYAFAGPLWERGVRESFEHVILARLFLATLCLAPCVLRFGNDALLLLGLGEVLFALVLRHTENITTQTLVETAKEVVNQAQGQAQGVAGRAQDQAQERTKKAQ